MHRGEQEGGTPRVVVAKDPVEPIGPPGGSDTASREAARLRAVGTAGPRCRAREMRVPLLPSG